MECRRRLRVLCGGDEEDGGGGYGPISGSSVFSKVLCIFMLGAGWV